MLLLRKCALLLVSDSRENNWAQLNFDPIATALYATVKHAHASPFRQKHEFTCTWSSHSTPIICIAWFCAPTDGNGLPGELQNGFGNDSRMAGIAGKSSRSFQACFFGYQRCLRYHKSRKNYEKSSKRRVGIGDLS